MVQSVLSITEIATCLRHPLRRKIDGSIAAPLDWLQAYEILRKSAVNGGTSIAAFANITQLIEAHRDGDVGAYDRAVALLYEELRRLAHFQLAKVHGNATLQTTAVVNEAYLKLKAIPGTAVSREHFLGIASKAMRHVIIDYARTRNAKKRGGEVAHVDIEDANVAVQDQAAQLLNIDQALGDMADQHPRLVRVIECRFFAGLDDKETANVLGVSERTAQRDWMKAKAFLRERLSDSD
jgi:RNA polymerase sigma factor (TIGR02999 family)